MSAGRRRKGSVPPVAVAERLRSGPAPTTTVVARPRRADVRAERLRRRRRFRLLLVAPLALGVLLVGWVVLRGDEDEVSDTRAAGAQQTLLVQVLDAKRRSVVQAIVGHDPAGGGRGAVLLLPSQLIVDAPGVGSRPLRDVAPIGETRSAEALSDLLAMRIDGTWALTETGLTRLIDGVGGVDVDVDVAVLRGNQVVLPPGPRRLTGALATGYATYLGAGEPEQARLARFSSVLRQVLVRFPPDESNSRAAVVRIADQARATLPSAVLAGILRGLHGAVTADRVAYDSLRVRSIEVGTSLVAFGINETASAPVLKALFPRALTDRAGGQVRVLVQNGPRLPGLVADARKRLVDRGFRFINGGNAPEARNESVVVIADAGPEARASGEEVARALGLRPTTIRIATQGQTVADVIVILGRDFKP